MRTLVAHTAAEPSSFPPYLNVTEYGDGAVSVTVREEPSAGGKTTMIMLPPGSPAAEQLRKVPRE